MPARRRPSDPMAARRTELAQKLDHELVDELMRFARSQLGEAFLDEAAGAFTARGAEGVVEGEPQLLIPWLLFGYEPEDGRGTVAERFYEKKGRYLMPDLRELLAAQMDAWLSLWQVERVDPGTGADLRDLLSGETRYVYERLGTASLPAGIVLLARVVDVNDISFLAGVHVHPLPADRVWDTLSAARKHFRVRTRPVPVERLRHPEFQQWLIEEWREMALALTRPPTLSNTDGDPFEPMVDHFAFETAAREQVIAALATVAGAVDAEEGDTAGETVIVITKRGNLKRGNRRSSATQNTMIGLLRVGSDRLRVETNSRRRADAVRRAVEKAAGALVRHRLREETSTEQLIEGAMKGAEHGRPARSLPAQPPEALEIVREFKRRHYAAWLDERIPALGGLTPRKAAKSPTKRDQLENLLRRLEEGESALPEEERFDVGWLRSELGL